MHKPCRQCGSIFLAKIKSQDFCSYNCRGLFDRRIKERLCPQCSIMFLPTNSMDCQIHCSRRCAAAAKKFLKHGGSYTRLYQVWDNMKQRCYNPNNPKYIHYGGRGIGICNEWRYDFSAFESWALSREDYSDDKSIDRFPNNNGNYEPSNCRWATDKEQRNNMKR